MYSTILMSASITLTGTRIDNSGFAMGTGSALWNNIQCTGSEQRLLDCMSDPLGMPLPCAGQAAALMCQESKQLKPPLIIVQPTELVSCID